MSSLRRFGVFGQFVGALGVAATRRGSDQDQDKERKPGERIPDASARQLAPCACVGFSGRLKTPRRP